MLGSIKSRFKGKIANTISFKSLQGPVSPRINSIFLKVNGILLNFW